MDLTSAVSLARDVRFAGQHRAHIFLTGLKLRPATTKEDHMTRLAGRVAVVTGAGSGLGRATASMLAEPASVERRGRKIARDRRGPRD